MEANIVEKRRYPRIKVKLPLKYQVRGSKDYDNLLTEDLSEGGLSFSNNKFIAPLTKVMLELTVLKRVLSPVGKIAWISPIRHSNRYRMGVEFEQIELPEKAYLSDYINLQLTSF